MAKHESRMKIQYQDLGLSYYREVWELQEKLLEKIKLEKSEGVPTSNYLLFTEHRPVYTLGKSGHESNMLMDAIQLRTQQAEFIKVDRGGDITFHGPGQLVVYPIIDLENFGLGVKEYVHRLEEVVIRTLRKYGIKGERINAATGVWLDVGKPSERKICAIGVKCSRYVSMHGFALNVNTDLNYFNYIHPCGFVDKGVTSIERENEGKSVGLEEVKEEVLTQFKFVFNVEIQSVE
ncbi:lipoyl(octanoyl) transferase LipB [uncultured Odoribacter sp.]|uniref:lipoyl(octanoyl) transferase LipB n=1 Tax=uncultured Odoribacter sp. TaxID=876416 RepID=UPI002638F4A0|nr:lipoyl(octanoyl) transferase LipB [uncultured Odoribacter sp.]